MKILIVDDSESLRHAMSELILSVCKAPVLLEATSVAEGIRLSKTFQVDAVLLDIRFPDGLGFEVLRAIRQIRNEIIVIVLTNFTSDQFREKALAEGADYFLDKSTDFEKAVEILKEMEAQIG